ncbi:substrate-binding domain-containing protein [Erysipelothrix sp. HDW6C]|uniref:ABC transporter substrate-binding protein n=1 Tax=Erysipelothrix sp. HDW6C TaxID=2714930 RepID=UPI00140B46B5|nr:ABC transporter substrate-binding protein [Erysipelothrix sp. HDW6C]QIK70652.1 substrate-binding domain-containing protein [Erysipelothrix sp. HDW6C]
MKLKFKKVLAVLLVSLLVLTGCSKGDGGSTDTKYKIYLITMDQMDQHWVKLKEGAEKASQELGNVEFTWLAPDVKDDAKQIEAINNAIAGGADAILLAANGPDAVTSALKEAEAEGIKIVYVDSAANFDAVQTLATDNKAAGKVAGEELINALKEKGVTTGNIGVVSTNSATASSNLREEGFRSAFDGTEFKVLETQYGEGDVNKSKDIATNFITNGAVGLFGTNEGSTVGAGNAVVESQGKAIAVGFDTSDTIISLIKDGSLLATMVQNPDVMGYEGIKVAVKALQGETISSDYFDTGVTVVNKENAQ